MPRSWSLEISSTAACLEARSWSVDRLEAHGRTALEFAPHHKGVDGI